MKKVQHYICEICGTEYNDESVCIKCEKGHHAAKCISGCRYLSNPVIRWVNENLEE